MLLNVALAAANVVAGKTAEAEQSGLVSNLAELINAFIGKIPQWIAAFVILVVFFGLSRIAKSAVEGKMASKLDEEHQDLLVLSGRITYVGTLTLGIIIALKVAGVDLTALLAAGAFGIGFALRDLIMNFLAGVMILINRQFTIGDFIKVGSATGKIVEIQSRVTILKSVDGTKIIVPNSEFFTNAITSFTSNPMRRVVVPLYAAYGTDLDYATKIALRVLKHHPKILKKPGPSVIIKDYGDSTIDLAARFWILTKDGVIKVRSEILKLMDKAFQEAGIDVPYNVLHLETSQDSAVYEKEELEAEKAMREKLEAEKLAKLEKQNGNGQTAAATTTAVTAAASTASPVTAPLMPQTPVPVLQEARADLPPSGEETLDEMA